MKFFKNIKLVAAALLICAGFTACSEDEPKVIDTQFLRFEHGFYVINQGNMGVLDGTLDFFKADGTRFEGVFKTINEKSLGDTPQRAVLYGSKLYLPVFTENKVWVLDANTARVLAEVNTNQPEAVCGANGYVFVSNNDGYVTRVDTTSFTASAPLAVGPNPANMTTYNNKVYVSISDGYNYGNGYANGFKVAEIDAAQFNVTRNITVGMNPGDITSDILTTITSAVYDTTTGELVADNFLPADNLPANPIALDVCPTDGSLYICSLAHGCYLFSLI